MRERVTCRNTKKTGHSHIYIYIYIHKHTHKQPHICSHIKLHLDFLNATRNIHTAFRSSWAVAHTYYMWLNGGYDGWRMYGGEVGFREHAPFQLNIKLSGCTYIWGRCAVHVWLESMWLERVCAKTHHMMSGWLLVVVEVVAGTVLAIVSWGVFRLLIASY